jgi:hypothetical protein
MDSLFPNIKAAMRGKVVREEDIPLDPLDTMQPQDRQNYMNELQKLDNQENQLRLKMDTIKQQKMDLKKKYKLDVPLQKG